VQLIGLTYANFSVFSFTSHSKEIGVGRLCVRERKRERERERKRERFEGKNGNNKWAVL
jgi:hypothetical protein